MRKFRLAARKQENRVSRMSTTLSPVAYDGKIEGNVIFTQLDAAINWMRSHSLWPMPMGLACCAIELMAASSSRFDISRFGAEVMRFSPRQADVMIVAGTVTYKMALAVKRIWIKCPSRNGASPWARARVEGREQLVLGEHAGVVGRNSVLGGDPRRPRPRQPR
mgnify:CR=1 FL=1